MTELLERSSPHHRKRGCVVLDQPQRVARSKVLRLFCDTAALRSRTGRVANATADFQARAFAMT